MYLRRGGSSPPSPTILLTTGVRSVDFFDDEATGPEQATQAPPPRRRRRPDRRRTRIQRIVILAAHPLRRRLRRRLVGAQLPAQPQGRRVSHLLRRRRHRHRRLRRPGQAAQPVHRQPHQAQRARSSSPSSGQLGGEQQEIAVRAARLEPPGTLDAEQDAVRHRHEGARQRLQPAAHGHARRARQEEGRTSRRSPRWTATSAARTRTTWTWCTCQSRQAMSDEGVTDVEVPTSTYYLTTEHARPQPRRVGAVDSVGSSAKLTGIHGVALVGVDATSAGTVVQLVKGRTVNVPASADLAFEVKVAEPGRRGRERRARGRSRWSCRTSPRSSRPAPSPPSPPARRRA